MPWIEPAANEARNSLRRFPPPGEGQDLRRHRLRQGIAASCFALGILGAFAVLGFLFPRNQADPAPQLTQTLARVVAQPGHVAQVGETSHRHAGALDAWRTSPAVMRHLRTSGLTVLCIESFASMQPWADRLAAGKIPARRYANEMLEAGYRSTAETSSRRYFLKQANTIQAASRAGLKVALVDFENGALEGRRYYEALRNSRINSPLQNFGPEGQIAARWPQISAEKRKEILALRDAYLQARTIDAKLVEKLAQLTREGEKLLLIYGAAHSKGEDDLDEHLARKGVTLLKINVFAEGRDLAAYGASEPDKPDGRYVFSTGQFFPATKAPDFLQRQ